MNRNSIEEKTHMTNKNMNWSTSLLIPEDKLKPWYTHFIPIQLTKMKKLDNTKCWRECKLAECLIQCFWECKMDTTTLESLSLCKCWTLPYPVTQQILLLGIMNIYPRKTLRMTADVNTNVPGSTVSKGKCLTPFYKS